MQTDHLRFLLEIARQGSINKAAEVLHLPRTHLSRVLAGLEESFGVPLFERLPRGVRPTEEGQYVLTRIEEALTILDDMLDHIHSTQKEVYSSYCDRINFYCPSNMRSRGQVAQVLEKFQERFPNVQLIQHTLHHSEISTIFSNVENPLILALRSTQIPALHWTVDEPLRYITLNDMPLVALVGESHPLATLKTISLKSLCQEPLILISSEEEQPLFYDLLAHYGTPNVKQVITGNIALFQQLVASGKYASLGTASSSDRDGLIEISLKEKITTTAGLLFSPESMKNVPLHDLAELLLKQAGADHALPQLNE